jgi:hypothetical protein
VLLALSGDTVAPALELKDGPARKTRAKGAGR